ncbi:MAG: AraC family transcriptional regulator [Oscillospiraceae bacterium]|nr:AraC family transcriptional regulator [Oscillospiraceae bacterium]MBQ9985044.1 AraC family transcriptional regulator [Oscillospiraceae bacterium]
MNNLRTNKRIFFNETWDTYYKLRNIGYHDFHIIKPTKFARIYDWTSLHFVVSGKGTLIIRDKVYKLCAGDFFYIPANEPTIYYSDDIEPWSYYWISFSKSSGFKIEDILKLSNKSPKLTAKDPQKVSELFDALFSLEVSQSEFSYMTVSMLMQLLACEATHSLSPSNNKISPKKIVSTVKQIIELNHTNPNFNIKEIAPVLYLSTRQVDRIFKDETGMTPRAYLIDVKLFHVTQLLKENDYKVKELCRIAGFFDEFQFMKIFKAKFGMTVKEYRRSITETL